MISRATLLAGAVITGCCGFAALLGWAEYSNWTTEVSRVKASLRQTAESIAQHTDDLIEMSRLPLSSMIAEIRDEQGVPTMPSKIKLLITQQMKASPTLDTLSYIDAEGALIASTGQLQPGSIDLSEREYFRFHQKSLFPLPVVGKPIVSRLSTEWVIPVTQKVVLAGGVFGGAVVSTVRVGHFIDFFRRFNVGSEGSFLIARGDGIILARGPMEETLMGANISSTELFSHYLKAAPGGAYRYQSPLDGTWRIGAYTQSARSGIVVLAAASESQVLAQWLQTARIRWTYTVLLMLAVFMAIGVWRHVSAMREKSEAMLASREAEFRLLAESSSDVIARFDQNGIREYVSPSSADILGIEPHRLVGKSVFAGLDAEAEIIVREVTDRIKAGSRHEKFVLKHTKPTGEEVWLETVLNKLPSTRNAPSRAVAISRDITRQKAIEDELNALASTDELTKLANRRTFNIRFEEMVQRARRSRAPLSLLMIDADHFKAYNDTYGHAAGDECLRQLSAVIRRCVQRPTDLACRYGGEELAVLLADTDERGAVAVAEKIRKMIRLLAIPHAGNSPEFVTVSIGAATLDVTATAPLDSQQFFAAADMALYRAKKNGRNRVVSSVNVAQQASIAV